MYVSVGPQLCHYALDTNGVALLRGVDSAALPANVQYACADASRRTLYVVSSNGGPGIAGDRHYATALRIDAGGALARRGEDVLLPHRPIHITTDGTSEHALIAYNNPSGVTVHKIGSDGSFGSEVRQPQSLDAGIFAHQICVTASNRQAILVTRGNDPEGDRLEDPGALKVFSYRAGVLGNLQSIAPRGGYAFGPRNIAISPTCDWIYVSLERQNKLSVFRYVAGAIASEPSFEIGTLAGPANVHAKQLAGSVQVHPSGRFVYVANRAFGTTSGHVFTGGENTIVVYAIDGVTGRPSVVQSINTHGISPRTFSIDAEGKTLVVGNSMSALVKKGTAQIPVEANVSVFSIGGDGRLTHRYTHAVESSSHHLFWLGIA